MRPNELVEKWRKTAFKLKMDAENYKHHYKETGSSQIMCELLTASAKQLEKCADELEQADL